MVTCILNRLTLNEIGLYENTTVDISDAHPTYITPATWAFSIWDLIYFWQTAWLIYALIVVLLGHADIMPRYTYIFYVISNIANVCWLVVWSQELMIWALTVIIIATLTLYIATAGSYLSAVDKANILSSSKLSVEVWLMRGLVQNGLALYSTWLSVATLINLTIVLGEETELSMSTASTISLVVLCVEIIGLFIVDVFSLDKFTRYVVSPYFVYGFALSAIYDNNHDVDKSDKGLLTNYILTIICLSFAWVLFVVKIIVTIQRHIKSNQQSQHREDIMLSIVNQPQP